MCQPLSPDSSAVIVWCVWAWHWYWYFALTRLLLVYWIVFTVYCFQRMLRVFGARYLYPDSPPAWTTTAEPWPTGRSPLSSSSRSYLAPYLQKWFLSKVDAYAIYLSICNFKDGEYIRVNWMAIPFAMRPHGHSLSQMDEAIQGSGNVSNRGRSKWAVRCLGGPTRDSVTLSTLVNILSLNVFQRFQYNFQTRLEEDLQNER